MIAPVELRAPVGARWMEIVWSDGVTSRYHHSVLRGFCPCAYCQGHQGPIRWASGAEAAELDLEEVEEVGNYAVRLKWKDGHGTGIYTFRYLRELGALADRPPEEVRAARFGR